MRVRGNLPNDSAAVCVVIEGNQISAIETLGPAIPSLPYQLSGELRPSAPANVITYRAEAQSLQVENVIVGGEVAGSRSSC